ncbi:hypothetical protein R1flu_023743 [Riccia fluitans]|uniref:Uncharacterized protein n=1 Tax=Riccia fluitans TaxID=41844 RepID=A0ABD1XSX7_9MARC
MRPTQLVEAACLLLTVVLISVEPARGRVLLAAGPHGAQDTDTSNLISVTGMALPASKISLSTYGGGQKCISGVSSSGRKKLHFQKLPRDTNTPQFAL